MSKKILLIISLLYFQAIYSQNKFESREFFGVEAEKVFVGAKHVWMKQENIVPTFMEFRAEKAMSEADFLLQLKKNFRLANSYSFKKVSEEKDQIGFTHKRFQLEVNHIPVVDAIFILHLKEEKVIKYNGYLFNNVVGSTIPILNENKALGNAIYDIGANIYKWELAEEESFIQKEQKNASATFYPKGELVLIQRDLKTESNNFVLSWKFDVYAHEPMGRYNIYVDASTGAIIKKENKICTADAAGTATTVYRGIRSLSTDSITPTNYRLAESGRGLGIHTYDMQRGTSYGASVDFTDSNNVWNNVNPNLDEYATDAHWGAEMTYDFYASQGRSSIDGAGYPLNLYVHYSTGYLNAYWDGSRMTFGDAYAPYKPLVSLDITGHEIAHGLDQLTAGLTYSYESGALNESFSDIFGVAVEYFADSATSNWLLGEDIGLTFRSLSSPNTYGDPDTYLGTNWYTGSGDAGGVHTNSGVQNYWYYLLSMGGSGTNDIGSIFSVSGLGRDKATDIAWRSMVNYLTPSSQYIDARFYAIQSAVDLYGACTPEVASTTNAWYAVGVGAAYTSTVDAAFTNSMTIGCTVPFTVSFNNRSFNADVYSWNFGDDSLSSAVSPSHTYTRPGNYTVQLIASGGACGIDSVIYAGLVSISDTNPCVAVMPTSGSGSIEYGCVGTMYDDGGRLGLYSDNVDANITISPTGASSVTLNFTSFRMEYAYDTLFVYDGPSTSSPLIQSTTGNTLPASITSSGPSITVRQFTDGGVVDTGFALTWSCNILAPITNFRALDSVTCSGIVAFTDLSLRSPTNWYWSFGDGDSSFVQNPIHRYYTNGSYTVRLIASNSAGADTLTKTVYIIVNKPTGPITINGSRCNAGNVLLGVSPALGTFNWYSTNTSDSIIGTGLSFVTPFLSLTTTYYAESTSGACISLRSPVVATIKSTSVGSFSVGICSGSSYFYNGLSRLTSGTYLDTLINVEGCDSLLSLFLTVNSSSSASISTSICSGDSYLFNGVNLLSAGSYRDTLINRSGCDSFLTLNLTVSALSGGTISSVLCPGSTYLFNGITRSVSGTYFDTLINVLGCDSFVTLNLTFLPIISTALPVMICEGSSYRFNGVNRAIAGSYRDTLTSGAGCDSFVTLILGIRNKDTMSFAASICSGTVYFFNGVNLSAAGTYLDTSINSFGCDSFSTLNLLLLYPSSYSFSVSICSGTTYLFNGVNIGVAGVYRDTLINFVGCDSILTLNISLLSNSSDSISTIICNGSSYFFNGLNRTTPGIYKDTLINFYGCDSLVTLNLVVNMPSLSSFNQIICEGDFYFFNGINRNTAGSFLDTLVNIEGCDSFVTMNLTVANITYGTIAQSISSGSSYFFNGINLTATGTYLDTLQNQLGCDSFLTLNLTVQPTSVQNFDLTVTELAIMPNPATFKTRLIYHLNLNSSAITLALYDIQGQVVMNDVIVSPATTGSYDLDITPFADGIYFMKVNTDHSNALIKLIIEK